MSELRKVCRASCFALFPAQHRGRPNPLCRLCSHRVVQMVWLRPPFLSCKVGKWWGKFVSAWNDSSPRSPGLSCCTILKRSQHVPYTIVFLSSSFFFNNLITTSCSLSPRRMQGSRCGPPIISVVWQAGEWQAGHVRTALSQHSTAQQTFQGLSNVGKRPSVQVCERYNLAEVFWRSVSPHSLLTAWPSAGRPYTQCSCFSQIIAGTAKRILNKLV